MPSTWNIYMVGGGLCGDYLAFWQGDIAFRTDSNDKMFASKAPSVQMNDNIEGNPYARFGLDKQNQHSSAKGRTTCTEGIQTR